MYLSANPILPNSDISGIPKKRAFMTSPLFKGELAQTLGESHGSIKL